MECSVPVGPKVKGETQIRRSALSPNDLVSTPAPGVNTLYDVLQYNVKKIGTKQACMAYRNIESIVEEEKEVTKVVNNQEIKEKKTWKYFKLSDFIYLNYEEVSELTRSIGAGLVNLGLQKNSKVEIFSVTGLNWMLVTHGCFSQGMTIVTAYDTLGESGLAHSMNETEVTTIFTNADLLPTIKIVAGKVPSLIYVIYDGKPKGNILEEIKESFQKIQFISLDELKELGRKNPVAPNPPSAQDYCCIMYTSGSTGNPKGVMLTHANIVAAVAGVNKMLQPTLVTIGLDNSLLAFLPLAHVLEFTVEHVCIFWGVTLGYGNIRTLTDASVRDCLGDIRAFKPTLLVGVPAVWESIRKGVLAKVNAGSPALQKIFYAAFKTKGWLLRRGLPAGILDNVVFNKIKDQTGGRLKYALSGGAPVSPETQEFLTITVCPILQGYGLTETCGMCGIDSPDVLRYGTVGSPVPCLEVKLVDEPNSGYLSTNLPCPQGEIWIRGNCITEGYYKNEALTRESFTEDKWFQTGDIGEWKQDGSLAVIDRKKNLVKLSNGEYIALEKLESIYKSILYVSNICVYADSFQTRPVALIVPLYDRIMELAKEKGLGHLNVEELYKNKEICTGILNACSAQAKKADLKPAEIISAITLVPDEWTSQNGLLTAAQKLKRKDILEKYKEELDHMYGIKK
ncbi:hypothetical protein Glove_279g36 [Diversispora epigaea]|uniref:AMP-dependent synthetase/ligase domain-containing protein n=1 Tax=Diversispora epigaea TaxID=1348612 RepID=A0A397IAB1_9GLOM|nr:hypothetical protein Glove_279g36 [Diversispora epigaea]